MESQKLFVFLFFLAILSEMCYAVAPNNFVYDILKAVRRIHMKNFSYGFNGDFVQVGTKLEALYQSYFGL